MRIGTVVVLGLLCAGLFAPTLAAGDVYLTERSIALDTNTSTANTSTFVLDGCIKDIQAWVPYWTGTDTTATLALRIKPFGSDVPTTATYTPIGWTDVTFTASDRAESVKCNSAILSIYSYGSITLTLTVSNSQTADRKMWVRLLYER